jgi:hypothetical protein
MVMRMQQGRRHNFKKFISADGYCSPIREDDAVAAREGTTLKERGKKDCEGEQEGKGRNGKVSVGARHVCTTTKETR